MKTPVYHSRRNFLKGMGSLTIALPFWGSCLPTSAETSPIHAVDLPGSLRRTPQINAWLEILEDGNVRIFSGKVELGQGIRVAIQQVASEELNIDLEQVEVILAETGKTPNEGYTAGSGSIQNSAMAVRYAAAAAREQLIEIAANKLNVSSDQLTFSNGSIRNKNGQSLNLFEVIEGRKLEGEVKMPVKLKPKSQYQYVGQSISRMDLHQMVTGKPLYVQDMHFPDMVYARVLRPKNYKAQLINFDEEGLKQNTNGLIKVVRDKNFLGVIATDTWQVEKAIRYLKKNSQWTGGPALPSNLEMSQHMRENAEPPKTVKEYGDFSLERNTSTIKGTYFKPYTMHNSLGPAAAVALWDEKVLHLWSHSQGIYPLKEAIKSMLNLPDEQVHIIGVPGPGCFGHTVSDDAAADAALLALAYPNRHIKVQWSREDENAWEPYGSAMIMEMEASLNEDGKIDAWHSKVWTDSHSTRPNGEAATILAARHIEGGKSLQSRGYLGGGHRNADPYYDIPNLKVDAHFFDGPLRVSSLRSLGAYANIFAIESLMEELAAKAGKNSLEFRKAHLTDERAVVIIEKLEEITKEEKTKANEGVGYAFARYKNNAAYCAVAAKVLVDQKKGTIKLLKMWATVDVGEVINPDGLKNQTEGGLIQAASWTLMEAVDFDNDHITSLNWGTYPIMRMKDAPDLEVQIINRPQEPAMGGGEASIPPTPAAITNAIFNACGKRIYQLPVKI